MRLARLVAICSLYALAAGCVAETGLGGGGGDGGDGGGGDIGGRVLSDATGGSGSSDADAMVSPNSTTRYFPAKAVWYRDYSSAKVDPDSKQIIAWLDRAGGWGLGRMQIDFSITVLRAPAGTPVRSFTKTDDFYTPDCDFVKMPVPARGALEGESGYSCTGDGDCHLIVVHPGQHKLYEMWRADISGGTFRGGCLAVWDMTRVYGPRGRGDQCSSADAAGFPIAPLLFSPAEVKAGRIDHAIRFILPNSRIRDSRYVRPASHGTKASSGGSSAPPYGAHLRLKADVDISKLTPGAQVVARAMKKYGMFLADGGQVALTAASDRFSATKWKGLLGARDLASLKVTDFEVIDHGSPIAVTYDCVRVR